MKLISFGNQLNSPPCSLGLVISCSPGYPQEEYLEIPPRISSGLHSVINHPEFGPFHPAQETSS